MVLLESESAEPFKQFNSFELESTTGRVESSQNLMGKNGLVIIFTCNHCPYAKPLWGRLINDYNKMLAAGFNMVAINPNNHPDYPDDSFENMVALSKEMGLPFHYLIDKSQLVAKSFGAVCTPDIFVLDHQMRLIYRGAYHRKSVNLESQELTLLSCLKKFDGSAFIPAICPSMGCSIKWQT